MPKSWSVLALLPGLLAAPLPAQSSLTPAQTARIDSLFRRFGATGSPGCALGVVRDGVLAYARGYGLASVELGVPITPATVFDIGSVSKQFTAMSVVLLALDGKLSLDDEIQKLVPEVPRYAQPVTLRHLLHHTSGLRDYIDVLGWSGLGDETVTTDADALGAIHLQQRPNFPPGSEFLYSNTGYFLLSVVVERASGTSLRDFAAERIFRPLGMTHTQYVNRHDMIVPGKAGSYTTGDDGTFALALANWEQTGDGAVNTTVEDLVKWDQNFYTPKVGGAAALRELLATLPLTTGKPNTYALGNNVDTLQGHPRVSHGGSWAGFRAQLTRFPNDKLSIITLCNLATAGPGLLAANVGSMLLGLTPATFTPFTPRPGQPAPWRPGRAELAALTGVYHSDELMANWVLTLRGDSLIARPGLGAEFVLRPVSTDVFSAFGTQFTIHRDGGVVTLAIDTRGLRDFRLTRLVAPQ